jgi:hypothetical protein
VASNRIFVIGGTRTDTLEAVETVEVYDPISDRWTTAANMPTPRSQVGAATVGGKIYAVGGNAGHELVFEVYDPVTDRWSVLPPLPSARRNAAVVAIGRRLYVAGGVQTNGSTPLGTLDEFDLDTGKWSSRAAMAIARTDHAASACEGRMVVTGGFNRGPIASVEAYDPASDRWSALPPLPAPAQFPASTCVDGSVFVVGGSPRLPAATATVFVWRARPAATAARTSDSDLVSVPAKPPFSIGRRAGRFTVFAGAEDARAAADVALALHQHAPQIARDLAVKLEAPVVVELFADQASLDRDGMNPRMRGHYAYSGNRRIQMVSPRNPTPVSEIAYPDRLLIAVHELAHLAIDEINPRLEGWLDEGAATFIGPHGPYAHACRHRFPFKLVPTLRDLERSYHRVPAGDLFAYALVEFIVESHGLPTLNRLLRAPESIEQIIGLDRDELERQWLACLQRKYAAD